MSWIKNHHYSGIFGLMKLTLPKVLPQYLEMVRGYWVFFHLDTFVLLSMWSSIICEDLYVVVMY